MIDPLRPSYYTWAGFLHLYPYDVWEQALLMYIMGQVGLLSTPWESREDGLFEQTTGSLQEMPGKDSESLLSLPPSYLQFGKYIFLFCCILSEILS